MKSSVLSGQLAVQFAGDGFAMLPHLYSPAEVAALLRTVGNAPGNGPNFRRSQEVFAIRDVLGEVPELWPLFNTGVLQLDFASVGLPAGLAWRERRQVSSKKVLPSLAVASLLCK